MMMARLLVEQRNDEDAAGDGCALLEFGCRLHEDGEDRKVSSLDEPLDVSRAVEVEVEVGRSLD